MGLSCDLSRRTHAKLGICLVECVFAVGEVQNVGLKWGHSKSDLNVYHSNESCTALLSKLYRQPRDLDAHSSSFRNIRLPQAGKQTRSPFTTHQTYRANDGDIICSHMPVWDRIVLWFALINPGAGYSPQPDLPQPMLRTWYWQLPPPLRAKRGICSCSIHRH
jgi:hypothetical protein